MKAPNDLIRALAALGLRASPDIDGVAFREESVEVAIALRRDPSGTAVSMHVTLPASDLGAGPGAVNCIDIFREVSLEGHPASSCASIDRAGVPAAVIGFDWLHPTASPWSIAAERIEFLMQRVATGCRSA